MRTLLALTALVGLIDPLAAQNKDKDAKLKVGDKAPAVKATKWLQGAEVKEFAEGKVYVMEFWATWCGPCIVMMPHMGELQAEYKAKGVTFIGFTAKDPNNTLEKVQALVEKRGPKLGYTFAYADDRETYDAWMKAAGQGGIPCCYVVDKGGKVAYIGHPMYLDLVLPKVVAGTWGEADRDGLKEAEKDVNGVFQSFGGDAEAALKTLGEFEKKYPELASIPYFVAPRLGMLLKTKKYDEAKAAAEAVIAKAVKADDPMPLRQVSAMFRGPDAKDNKDLLPLSLKAAELALKAAGDKDVGVLYNLAEAYFAVGDKAKARDYGAKAIAAADNDNIKKQLETLTKKYEDEKKEKDEKKDK
jgi:thiol-disulfide isomerase/thioredoxin